MHSKFQLRNLTKISEENNIKNKIKKDSRSNALMHPLWVHRSRAEHSYLQSYFSLQNTLKLPKDLQLKKTNSFLTFKIYC